MPEDRPRQERSEQTRALIIKTAAAAFAEHGYDGVSLNDLIASSGLSKGAFYFHFPSKRDIALATFRSKQKEVLARLAEVPDSLGARERLAVILRTRATLLREDPSVRCITRLGLHFNLLSDPQSDYGSYLRSPLRGWADLIADGQRRGEFRKDVDPEAVARVLFAGTVGIDTLSFLSSGGDDLGARIDELILVILDGLLPRASLGPADKSSASREEVNTSGPGRRVEPRPDRRTS